MRNTDSLSNIVACLNETRNWHHRQIDRKHRSVDKIKIKISRARKHGDPISNDNIPACSTRYSRKIARPDPSSSRWTMSVGEFYEIYEIVTCFNFRPKCSELFARFELGHEWISGRARRRESKLRPGGRPKIMAATGETKNNRAPPAVPSLNHPSPLQLWPASVSPPVVALHLLAYHRHPPSAISLFPLISGN